MFKTIETGSYIIKLEIPDNPNNLTNFKKNNIEFLSKERVLLWDIGRLLDEFSKIHNLKYTSEIYFDIKITEDKELLCTGFINHCVVDLKECKIKRLINNR